MNVISDELFEHRVAKNVEPGTHAREFVVTTLRYFQGKLLHLSLIHHHRRPPRV